MRLEDVLGNEALRNEIFPNTQRGVYLAHAGVAPLSGPALAALNEYARRAAAGNQENAYTHDLLERGRRGLAEVIGARPHEVALVGPTTMGLNLVALGLEWEPGDEVVYYSEDYPSNVYPWSGLRAEGVEPRAIRTFYPGVITWDKIEPLLTDRTRLVSLATANFLSGYRPDVAEIGRRLREREILFCLDAIQTVGAFPLNVENVDFLACGGHKWLLGPAGSGFLYVAEHLHERLQPAMLGSWNVHSPDFVAQEDLEFEDGARRYDPSTFNLPGLCGLAASVELLLEIGIEAIAARLLKLRQRLLTALETKGYVSYLDDWEHGDSASDWNRSAIVSVFHKEHDMAQCASALAEAGVTVSLRRTRSGLTMLRFAPHFYTTEAELDGVVARLP